MTGLRLAPRRDSPFAAFFIKQARSAAFRKHAWHPRIQVGAIGSSHAYRSGARALLQSREPSRLGCDRRLAQLGDHLAPIRNQNPFALANHPDVLTEPILELPNPDRTHASNVASRGHLVQALPPRLSVSVDLHQIVDVQGETLRQRLHGRQGTVAAAALDL